MAFSDKTPESDARRMKRGFVSDTIDRVTGAGVHRKSASSAPATNARSKQIDDAEKKAVGFKAGGMVRRGYGKARGC